MKNQTCCFTGHRDIPKSEKESLQKRLENELISLIQQGVTIFKAGGALGFDTMSAQAVLKLKAAYLHIRLILVLPYKDQARREAGVIRTKKYTTKSGKRRMRSYTYQKNIIMGVCKSETGIWSMAAEFVSAI